MADGREGEYLSVWPNFRAARKGYMADQLGASAKLYLRANRTKRPDDNASA